MIDNEGQRPGEHLQLRATNNPRWAVAEIRKLRLALLPFAALSERYPDTRPDLTLKDPLAPVITMGDLHRAKEALRDDH